MRFGPPTRARCTSIRRCAPARPADARAQGRRGEPVEPLTEREREVLSLLGQGASNKEIASALFITERTARTHVEQHPGQARAASRTQAALYAVENKLVEPARD